jgi:hypothetical protein
MNRTTKQWIRIFWAFWPLFVTIFLIAGIVFSAIANNFRPLATSYRTDYTNTTCIAFDFYIENQTTVFLSRGIIILSRVVWVVTAEIPNSETSSMNRTAVWDPFSEGLFF